MGIRVYGRAGLPLIGLITTLCLFVSCDDNGLSPLVEQPPNFILQWGKRLDSEGRLLYPGGVAVDGSGKVYVIDAGHTLIQVYSDQGIWINSWQQSSSNYLCIAVDTLGTVYLETYNSDLELSQLSRFTPEGQELGRWPFANITGLSSDRAGFVYVNGNRIRENSGVFIGSGVWKLSATGEIEARWSHIGPGPITVDEGGNLYLLVSFPVK